MDRVAMLLGLMFLVMGRVSHTPHATDAMCLVLYGMPTILSGVILKFRPLIIGGFICWALVVVSIFIPVEYHLLLIAIAVIAAWIIPGYMLQNLYGRQNN